MIQPPQSHPRWTPDKLRAALPRGATYIGTLGEISHDELLNLLERESSHYTRTRAPHILLIIGAGSLPVTSKGDPIDCGGCPIIGEHEFLTLLGEHSHVGLFTPAALAEIFGIPEPRITSWIKAGLIAPAELQHGIPRLDFSQAALAQHLIALSDAGITAEVLRAALTRLQSRLPDLARPLAQLAILERNGPLLLRLECGQLSEIDGQLHMTFTPEEEAAGHHAPLPFPRQHPAPRTADAWHAQAVEQEHAGLLEAAIQSYRQAIATGGLTANRCFDLAHALADHGDISEAIERYRVTTELDPHHACAWTNLGVLLLDQNQQQEALTAFRAALTADPTCAPAHYNLADALDDAGHHNEAHPHWQAYLKLTPAVTPHTSHARKRLTSR